MTVGFDSTLDDGTIGSETVIVVLDSELLEVMLRPEPGTVVLEMELLNVVVVNMSLQYPAAWS